MRLYTCVRHSLAYRRPTGGGSPVRDLREVMHWVHHNTPLVNDPLLAQMAQETRQAALAFHSGILHERYVTGRTSRAPHNEPDFLVPQESTHLLQATAGGH